MLYGWWWYFSMLWGHNRYAIIMFCFIFMFTFTWPNGNVKKTSGWDRWISQWIAIPSGRTIYICMKHKSMTFHYIPHICVQSTNNNSENRKKNINQNSCKSTNFVCLHCFVQLCIASGRASTVENKTQVLKLYIYISLMFILLNCWRHSVCCCFCRAHTTHDTLCPVHTIKCILIQCK